MLAVTGWKPLDERTNGDAWNVWCRDIDELYMYLQFKYRCNIESWV